MKNLFKFLSVLMVFVGSLAFGQSQKEPSLTDVHFSNPSAMGKIGIKIHLQFGRVSLDCKGFGFCGGTIDVELSLKNGTGAEGYIVKTDDGQFLKFDLESPLDQSKFNTNLVIERDIEVNENGNHYIVLSGTYRLVFTDNRFGSYLISLK